MLFKERITKGKKYFIFVSLIALICLLGSIFSITYAYIVGNKDASSSSSLPFLKGEIYYNTTKLATVNESDVNTLTITGSISSTGAVTLKVGSATLTANAGGTINLPLYIKNGGNIDAEIVELWCNAEFKDSSDNHKSNTRFDGVSYYLTFNSGTDYTINNNMFFDYQDIIISKDLANSSQFLTSISVANDINTSELCGTTFTINIFLGLGQLGITEL